MTNKHMKRYSASLVIREKQITTHLIEWLKLKSRQHQVLIKMWSNWNSHTSLLGLQSGSATLENNLTLPYTISIYLP